MPFNKRLALCFLLLLFPHWALAAAPDIDIKGGPKSLRENIRLHLTLADESCKVPLWRLNVLLDEAEDEIQAAAQALGYYQLEYDAQLSKKKDCWGLALNLTPGEPVRVTNLRIEVNGEGRLDPIFSSLYDKPGIRLGNKLHHGRYETLKGRFGTQAASHGYFDGEFELAQVVVNRREKTAAIDLIYYTGPRYQVGAITLKHAILDEDFLRRYLNMAPGDPYDTDLLLELKNRYNFSNYFAAVNVAPDVQHMRDQAVPINITLEERKRREYSAGVGVATDTGPRLLLGFEDRYINSRGHSFSADLNTSNVKTTALAAYSIPMRRPADESLKLYSGYEREITDTSESRKYTYGTQFTHIQNNKWLHTYGLEYAQEDSIVGSDPEFSTDLIIPSVSLSRTQTDGALYPLRGWTLQGRLSGSPKTLGSDFSFVQFNGRAKYIYGGDWGRMLLRTEVGVTETDEFSDLPVSVRFTAGGDSSVRGYAYKSLGPKNMLGEVIGGNNLLVSSIEFDHRLEDSNWVLAAFMDQGNAADDLNIEFKRSLGVGVRWISPIGPIRIDVAKALDDDKGWSLHVTMGPDL